MANHKHRALNLISFLLMALTPFRLTLAQTDDVRHPPPPVQFDAWTRVENDHYTVRVPSAVVSGHESNNTFTLHCSLPPSRSGKVPVVVMLHYWGATDLKSEAALASKLNALGIAAVAIELPYHLQRAPEGTRSGELAIQPDPFKLTQTMRQAVSDVRRSVDWICSRSEFDPDRIGLAGTSLGSIVGALAFAVETRFKSYCSVLGGGQLSEILWGSSRLVREREQLRRQGFRKDSLAEALKPIEPLEYLDPKEARQTYLITARYDTVIPSPASKALREALPNSSLLWLETGHYGGFFVQSSVLRTVANFFSKSLNDEKYVAPKRLYSPTLRLCALNDSEAGLSVALGLDLWRPKSDGSLFGTVIVTPTGFRGFVGQRVSNGLAIGVQVEPKRTTPGVLWSFVL